MPSSISGADGVKKKLRRLAAAVPSACDQALEGLARDILAVAVANVPRRTGALARSGYVLPVVPGVIRIGFRMPYAASVHERLDAHHPNGGAKFLERAMLQGQPAVVDGLARAAQDALESESGP